VPGASGSYRAGIKLASPIRAAKATVTRLAQNGVMRCSINRHLFHISRAFHQFPLQHHFRLHQALRCDRYLLGLAPTPAIAAAMMPIAGAAVEVIFDKRRLRLRLIIAIAWTCRGLMPLL
jgi:hypothetical protein